MSVPIYIWLRSAALGVGEKRSVWGMGGASIVPGGTCFPCALVHLPVSSNGAQQGGMNRPESGNAALKLLGDSSAFTGCGSEEKKNPVVV